MSGQKHVTLKGVLLLFFVSIDTKPPLAMANQQTSAAPTVWDTKTQTYHGGQEHRFIENFVEDFSVTTNFLGTPKTALEAARDAVRGAQRLFYAIFPNSENLKPPIITNSKSSCTLLLYIQVYTCHHYPPANQEPAKSSLAAFLWPADHALHHNRLLLGNGASELIDLVVREARAKAGVAGATWKAGPWDVQYKEYQRSAETNGFTVVPAANRQRTRMACIVNPCNPTGDYMEVEEMKNWILENVEKGGTVIVGGCFWLILRDLSVAHRNVTLVLHSFTFLTSLPVPQTNPCNPGTRPRSDPTA